MKKKRIRFLTTLIICFAASTLLCQAAAQGFTAVSFQKKEFLQVAVHRLIFDPSSKQPIVLLTDSLQEMALPIWISTFEARAIQMEMQGIKHNRPLTHDLLERIILKTDGKISRIIIPYVKENIFYATIVMERGGSILEIDARPSDSLVLALKFKVPIFVSRSLFKDMSISLGGKKGVEAHYGLTLQDLTPSLARAFSFESKHGVLVSDVQKGSRAEKDGIKRGDIFVEIGGQRVKNVTVMKNVLVRRKTPLDARIFRKAHFLTITLHPF